MRRKRDPATGWRLISGLVPGIALLVLASRQVDLGQAWQGIATADPLWAVLALLAVLLTTAAKIARWRGLFPGTNPPDLIASGRALLIGQLVNAALPARLGDLGRAYQIGARTGVSKATALGTIAAEKAFDVVCLLLCCAIVAAVVPLPPWLDLSLALVAAGGLLCVLLALAWPEERLLVWAGRWPDRSAGGLRWPSAGRVLGFLRRALAGLAALRQPRMALTAGAWSILIWALAAGTNYLLFQAFDLRLSFGAALSLLVALHIGIAPPSSPGRLGVFHAIALLSLQAFGVERSPALAYAVVLHLVVYLPQLVPGAVFLAWDLLRGRGTVGERG